MTVNVPENKPTEPISQEQTIETNKIETPNEQPAQTEEKQEDPNWRAFREARKKDKAEREAAERRAAEKEAEALALKAAMEAAFAKGSDNSYNQQSMGEIDETEEQRIEKKIAAALEKERQRERAEREARERAEMPMRLQQMHGDFNQVVSEENLEYLEFHEPEIATMLRMMPEGIDKWSYAYKMVKRHVPNASTAKKEAARAEQNNLKPKSISSQGVSPPPPTDRESQFDVEKRRMERWLQMKKIINGVG